MGIDKCRDPVQRAMDSFPHCCFKQLDGFELVQLQSLSPIGSFDKIFIDIGGLAELHVVMSLTGLYYKAFPKAVVVVKSKFFRNLLQDVQVFKPPLGGTVTPPGSKRSGGKGKYKRSAAKTVGAADGVQQQLQEHAGCEVDPAGVAESDESVTL